MQRALATNRTTWSSRGSAPGWTGVVSLLILLALVAPTQAKVPWPDLSQVVDIAADHLEITPSSQAAVFKGNVQVTQRQVKLSCQSLTVEYGAKGAITKLKASGRVELTGGGTWAKADRARYDGASRRITLSGHVELADGENRFQAESVTFLLDQQRAVLTGARGRLRMSGKDGISLEMGGQGQRK